MRRPSTASPWTRGVVTGLGFGLLALALAWSAQFWHSEQLRDRAEAEAASLAELGARITVEWMATCQNVHHFLALRGPTLLTMEDLETVRPLLGAALASHRDSLRAAVVVDGEGEVILAASAWREGTRPEWVRGEPAGTTIEWARTEDGGWFVAQEAFAVVPGIATSLRLMTAWDPADLSRRLSDLLVGGPEGQGLALENSQGGILVRVPGTAGMPGGALVEAVQPVGASVSIRGQSILMPPGVVLPWIAGGAAGLLAGLLVGWSASRSRRLVRDVEESARRAVAGDPSPPGKHVSRQLPGLGEVLEELGRQAAAVSAREEKGQELLQRLSGAAVLLCDSAGTVELAGGDTSEVLGRAPADLVGTALRRVFVGAAWEVLAPALEPGSAISGVQTVEVEVGRSRDDLGALEVVISTRGGERGHVLLVRQQGRRKTAVEFPATDSRHQRLVDLLGDGMAVVCDGRVELANPALARMLGLSENELVGSEFKKHVAAEDVLHLVHVLRSLPEHGKRLDVQLRRADSLETVDASIAAIPVEGGESTLLVVTDRTEARKAERRLQDAHRRLDATLDATSDGLLAVKTIANRSHVIVANRSFADMFGLRIEDLIDQPEADVFNGLIDTGRLPEGFGPWGRELDRHPGGRRTGRFEVSAGGARRVLEVESTPLFFSGREQPGRVIAFRDITAQSDVERRLREDQETAQARRRRAEESNQELERVNRQLEGRAVELDRANQALKRIDEKRSKLLAEVTHELQTPLVSIRGFTEMILRQKVGPVTPDQERGLQISLKNIDRLISLIDNLLDFIRAEGELPELKPSNFRLDELIGEVLELLRPEADKRSITLKAAYDGGRPVVRADRSQIQQAFINLVGNAIKFSPERREVVIEVAPRLRGFAQLIVRDSGPGIPAEHLQRIFDRGHRIPGSGAKGSGLGLYITRQILGMHGCSIKASSPEGGGAVFRFTLPLAREGTPLESSHSLREDQARE